MLISKKPLVNLSDISLITVNVLMILYAYFGDKDMAWVFWVYWAQSVIIGIFNFLRMLLQENVDVNGIEVNGVPMERTHRAQSALAFFFLFHYGFFHVIYVLFIISGMGTEALADKDIIFAIGLFFVNHLISFLVNNPRERKVKQSLGALMIRPYIRIVPMHLILMLAMLNSRIGGLLLMIVKAVLDVASHYFEHHKLSGTKINGELNRM